MARSVVLAVLALGLGGCADTTAVGPASADDRVVVDCRLPPQLRKLGRRAVYLVPGRLARTPARECTARGGEYTALER